MNDSKKYQIKQVEIMQRLVDLEKHIKAQDMGKVKLQIRWFKQSFGHDWKVRVIHYVAETLTSAILFV